MTGVVNSGNEEDKGLMEAIRILLRTMEELKTAIVPLIEGQEKNLNALKSHEQAITSLMDKLVGTKEDHRKRLDSLELLRTHISKLEEKLELHEPLHEMLEERLTRIELRPIKQIIKKIDAGTVSTSDLKVVEDILSFHPDNEYLWHVKIRILEQIDRKQEALEFLEKAVTKFPNSAWMWHRRGVHLEDFDESLKCLNKSLELLKDEPDPIPKHIVLYSRGVLFTNAERFKDALESATRSIELNPDCEGGWCLKGNILIQLGQITEALGCIEKSLELNNEYGEAWFYKALALSALGPKYSDEAIACYDKSLEFDPEYSAYFNKGGLLVEKDQYDQALETFDKGLELDNTEPCGWCKRGIILNRLKRNEEALESFQKASELGPPSKCRLILRNTAIVLLNLKRYKKAVEMFDSTIIEPRDLEELSPYLLGVYAEMLYFNKRYKEGVEMAQKAVEAEPENVEFWNILACNLQAFGKDEEALKAFEKALSLKKSDEEISWDDLAKLYERMGRIEEAKQAYQKFESLKKEDKIPK